MAIHRILKAENYTVMCNTHFKESHMSLKAKGLLSLMLSLPDEWDYSIHGLLVLSDDGETSVRGALKELEAHGYLIRTPIRTKGKIIDWTYDIYEIPHREFPKEEKPLVENPQLEKQTQLSTNVLNTKELYFDFLHCIITLTIVSDALRIFNIDFDSVIEEKVLMALLGIIGGAIIAFIWEFIVEEQLMKRPAIKSIC